MTLLNYNIKSFIIFSPSKQFVGSIHDLFISIFDPFQSRDDMGSRDDTRVDMETVMNESLSLYYRSFASYVECLFDSIHCCKSINKIS